MLQEQEERLASLTKEDKKSLALLLKQEEESLALLAKAREERLTSLKAYAHKARGYGIRLLFYVNQKPLWAGALGKMLADIRLCEKIAGKETLGWIVADEPNWDEKPHLRWKAKIRRCRKAVKGIAPQRKMVIFTPHLINADYFTPYADVIMYHYTPIPTRFPMTPDVKLVNQHMGYGHLVRAGATVRRLADHGQTLWTLVQLNNASSEVGAKYPATPKDQLRAPNAEEIRCSAFTSLAAGADGIWFWSLKGLMENKDNNGYLERIERWKAVESAVRELRMLDQVLSVKTPESFQDVNHVAAMVKGDGRYTYLIASNYDFETTDATLDFGTIRSGKANVFIGDSDAKPTTIRKGQIKVRLRPFERRVYRARGGPKSTGKKPGLTIGMWAVGHLDDIGYLKEVGFNALTPMMGWNLG